MSRKSTLPVIPDLTGILDKRLHDILSVFKQLIEIRAGGGQSGDRYVPASELSGLITEGYLLVADEKVAGTAGGAFTAGSWAVRTLNTIKADNGVNASLANNQIMLPAGTYRCDILAPAYAVNRHQARLRNASAGTTLLVGTSQYANNANTVENVSVIRGRFTLSMQSLLEVQHRCETTVATNGLGIEANLGEPETYTIATFWKERTVS